MTFLQKLQSLKGKALTIYFSSGPNGAWCEGQLSEVEDDFVILSDRARPVDHLRNGEHYIPINAIRDVSLLDCNRGLEAFR